MVLKMLFGFDDVVGGRGVGRQEKELWPAEKVAWFICGGGAVSGDAEWQQHW
jgi:hypothetical protein